MLDERQIYVLLRPSPEKDGSKEGHHNDIFPKSHNRWWTIRVE